MNRWLPLLGASLLFVACSTSKAAPQTEPDLTTEPSVIGAVDQATAQGLEEGAEGAKIGRRVGRVAGVLAAVLGGPESESADDMVDRYRATRDAATAVGAVIGATHGGVQGAKRGYAFDLQFASLQAIDGLTATRPFVDQIDVQIDDSASGQTVADVASVFNTSDNRTIDIEAPGDDALDMREALIGYGVPSHISAHRNDGVTGVVLHIRPL